MESLGRRDIQGHRLVVPGDGFEKRLSHLSEPNGNDVLASPMATDFLSEAPLNHRDLSMNTSVQGLPNGASSIVVDMSGYISRQSKPALTAVMLRNVFEKLLIKFRSIFR